MDFTLEIIGFNIESCLIAQASGAHRIELCDGPGEGGTTASYGFIKAAREKLHIGLYPIIRPRGGDFLYSDGDFEIMKTDVKLCRELGCDGVVIGLLNSNGTVDKKRTSRLVELAYPMGVTFHRAFDRTADPFNAMEDIIETGCERILTSGQQPNIMDGIDRVAQLVNQADQRIIIMPGSGIRSENIAAIAKKTGAAEFHSSARIPSASKMDFSNTAMQETLSTVIADENEIRQLCHILKEL